MYSVNILVTETGHCPWLLRFEWIESKLMHSFLRFAEQATFTYFVRWPPVQTKPQNIRKHSKMEVFCLGSPYRSRNNHRSGGTR